MVTELNTTFKIADVEELVNDTLDSVTSEDWKCCAELCKKLQDLDFVKKNLLDEILELIILRINSDESSDSEDDDDDF